MAGAIPRLQSNHLAPAHRGPVLHRGDRVGGAIRAREGREPGWLPLGGMVMVGGFCSGIRELLDL
jgi:hypothetical protein